LDTEAPVLQTAETPGGEHDRGEHDRTDPDEADPRDAEEGAEGNASTPGRPAAGDGTSGTEPPSSPRA
jgi:hypothetical protein